MTMAIQTAIPRLRADAVRFRAAILRFPAATVRERVAQATLRIAFLCTVLASAASAQNPFEIAPEYYKLVLDNRWVRVAHITYGPYEKAPMHDHPTVPAVYIYIASAGAFWLDTFSQPG